MLERVSIQGEEKNSVISVRLSQKTRDELEAECSSQNVTMNSLVGKILQKHTEWQKFATDMGFMSITKKFMREMVDIVPEEKLTKIAKTICKKKFTNAIVYLHGELTKDAFLTTLDLWLETSNLHFRHISNKSIEHYTILHELGEKWSQYYLGFLNEISYDLGLSIENTTCCDDSLAFDIVELSDS